MTLYNVHCTALHRPALHCTALHRPAQIVELSMRLIVMWSVPFNLNLYDTYMGVALIYNEVPQSIFLSSKPTPSSSAGSLHHIDLLVQQDVLQ
jgi:hypothetical protein